MYDFHGSFFVLLVKMANKEVKTWYNGKKGLHNSENGDVT